MSLFSWGNGTVHMGGVRNLITRQEQSEGKNNTPTYQTSHFLPCHRLMNVTQFSDFYPGPKVLLREKWAGRREGGSHVKPQHGWAWWPWGRSTKVPVLSHQGRHQWARCYLCLLIEHPEDLNVSQNDNVSFSAQECAQATTTRTLNCQQRKGMMWEACVFL